MPSPRSSLRVSAASLHFHLIVKPDTCTPISKMHLMYDDDVVGYLWNSHIPNDVIRPYCCVLYALCAMLELKSGLLLEDGKSGGSWASEKYDDVSRLLINCPSAGIRTATHSQIANSQGRRIVKSSFVSLKSTAACLAGISKASVGRILRMGTHSIGSRDPTPCSIIRSLQNMDASRRCTVFGPATVFQRKQNG